MSEFCPFLKHQFLFDLFCPASFFFFFFILLFLRALLVVVFPAGNLMQCDVAATICCRQRKIKNKIKKIGVRTECQECQLMGKKCGKM